MRHSAVIIHCGPRDLKVANWDSDWKWLEPKWQMHSLAEGILASFVHQFLASSMPQSISSIGHMEALPCCFQTPSLPLSLSSLSPSLLRSDARRPGAGFDCARRHLYTLPLPGWWGDAQCLSSRSHAASRPFRPPSLLEIGHCTGNWNWLAWTAAMALKTKRLARKNEVLPSSPGPA